MDLTTVFCVKIQFFLVCNKIWSLKNCIKKLYRFHWLLISNIFGFSNFFPFDLFSSLPHDILTLFLPKLLLLVYCFSDCIYFFTPNHALGKFFPNTDCLCFCVSCIYFDAFACFLTFSIILSKQRNISFVPDFFQFTMKIHKKIATYCSKQFLTSKIH